jgi:hypothetical protein
MLPVSNYSTRLKTLSGAMLTLERRRGAAAPAFSGTMRVATGECAGGFLARCLSGSTRTALPPGITLEAIRAGTGRGELPCYVGDGHLLLERLTPPIPEKADIRTELLDSRSGCSSAGDIAVEKSWSLHKSPCRDSLSRAPF